MDRTVLLDSSTEFLRTKNGRMMLLFFEGIYGTTSLIGILKFWDIYWHMMPQLVVMPIKLFFVMHPILG